MIPVFVIVRDRFEQLRQTVQRLEQAEGIDIVLVDNQTTYEPTVEYLKDSPHQVIYLGGNYGHRSPWDRGLVPTDSYFAVTDPDVRLVDECPSDWPSFMVEVLQMNPAALKAGVALRIDNLPDHYDFKSSVIQWESQFWQPIVGVHRGAQIYNAAVDTTLAMYAPGRHFSIGPALRTGWPYVGEHLAWYVNSSALTEDELYYRVHANRQVASWPYAQNL